MLMLLNLLTSLKSRRDEDGASAVEYGLLVAAIAAVVVTLVFALGGMISGAFDKTCEAVKTGTATTTANCA